MKPNGAGTYRCNRECKGCQPVTNKKELTRLVEFLSNSPSQSNVQLAAYIVKLERVVVWCSQASNPTGDMGNYVFFPPDPEFFRKDGLM